MSIKYFALFHVFYRLNNKRTHTSSEFIQIPEFIQMPFAVWTLCQSTVYAVPSEKLEHLSPHFYGSVAFKQSVEKTMPGHCSALRLI